jgi:hypothetical protein
MKKKIQITEEEKLEIMKMYITERSESENTEKRRFCHGGNVKTLEEIVGDDNLDDYIEGVKLRKNGINGLADRLELLKTLRLHPNITDGGEHLAYTILNQLKSYKPYNYFEEVNKECNGAMDKIIELYKENEHGEELVQDIEKVYAMSHLSARAKEFLKHCLNIIKEK